MLHEYGYVGGQYQGGIQSPYGPTGAQSFLPSASTVGQVLGTAAGVLINLATGSSSTASNMLTGATFPEGSKIGIDPTVGPARRRRRRRKLLTCGDKADIAFLHGQLGSGALGRSAISSLLARRC